MATINQIRANRSNAKRSTGPQTSAGKAGVRFNALVHGLRAESAVIPGEDQSKFDQLLERLSAAWMPQDDMEKSLVEQIAVNQWKLARIDRSEARIHDPAVPPGEFALAIHRVYLTQVRLERSVSSTIADLDRYRKSRIERRAAAPQPRSGPCQNGSAAFSMHAPVYLDHHATTPVDPRVLNAMLPFFGLNFGNAASRAHSFGWAAEKAVEHARKRVAHLAGAQPREIVFTSGATESNNLALKGAAEANPARSHFITGATEHRAVLDPLRHLERQGSRVTVLTPGPDGVVDLDRLRHAILPETLLVSVMYANNEIGVLQPVAEIGAICRERGVLFHCDAAQAFGKVPIDVNSLKIDLMSASAHKLYGPKGIGLLRSGE